MEQILLGVLLIMTLALFATISQMQHSIQYVHKRLDFITEQLGMGTLINEDELSTIHRLLEEGKQNKAIKAYRHSTGVGLKEAYDAIQLIKKNEPPNNGRFDYYSETMVPSGPITTSR